MEHGRLVAYRPVRTVDDKLAGYLIVALNSPLEMRYFPHIIGFFCVMMLIAFLGSFLMVKFFDSRFFAPIRKITKSAVFLSGDDSSLEGQDVSVMFDTKRTDEIGQLSSALQNVFFHMNSGAQNLSQAIYDANHDGMTRHLNKRCYSSMIETFRKLDSICVIYFDVNNLKLMNDTLGHENGDRVITRAADYIRAFMTEQDYCFRMGGDEFLMVMTNCTFRAADKVIEQLEKDAPYLLSREDDSVRCALAYGCAFAKGEYDYDALLAEAEENMYDKKTELKALWQMPDR
ncbi:MAG: GGDEF domain-containing protein [Oscillospiraceae bacterium]|nr:GGDEF domain-containing protein [Oscillospiraceae bacterium]